VTRPACPVLKGALVTPETGARGGEEGDIAGSAKPHRSGPLVPNLVMPDEPLNDLGNDCSFVFAHQVAIELAIVVFVAVVDHDLERGNGRAIGRSRAGCRQGRKTWLAGGLGQEGLETRIGKFEDRAAGAERRGDFEDAARVLREKSALGYEIGVNVGAAEAVDRLLGVSHQKQTARPQPASSPRLALISVSA
jgi:hypothetical protein